MSQKSGGQSREWAAAARQAATKQTSKTRTILQQSSVETDVTAKMSSENLNSNLYLPRLPHLGLPRPPRLFFSPNLT